MSKYETGILPFYAEDFLIYMETILNKSPNTIHEYFYDLQIFFRFMSIKKKLVNEKTPFDEITINNFPIEILASVNLTDLYSYLNYVLKDRKDQAPTRARKVASLRSFFKYAQTKSNVIKINPTTELDSPKSTKKLPRYLNLDESKSLLNSVEGSNKERDLCMITLFLNCGMRLSELVGIDIKDINEDTLIVTGKGDKERTIYLNDSCLRTISDYLSVRPYTENEPALFLSTRKKRISPKTVQYTVKKYITMANLDPQKYSTHKLRHTAATLMYNIGNVDIRALQEILGHESVATTEIYTHVNNARLKEAVNKNPLANFTADEKKDD